MTDRRLIGELWISVPSSQILGGIHQLPLKGIKERCRGLTPVKVVVWALMALLNARRRSAVGCRGIGTADIKATRWGLAGYRPGDWMKKTSSWNCDEGAEREEKAREEWQTSSLALKREKSSYSYLFYSGHQLTYSFSWRILGKYQ